MGQGVVGRCGWLSAGEEAVRLLEGGERGVGKVRGRRGVVVLRRGGWRC